MFLHAVETIVNANMDEPFDIFNLVDGQSQTPIYICDYSTSFNKRTHLLIAVCFLGFGK